MIYNRRKYKIREFGESFSESYAKNDPDGHKIC